MKQPHLSTLGTLGLCTLLASCSLLGNKPTPHVSTYTLEMQAPASASNATPLRNGHVLMVEIPRAVPGYDSTHMVYVRSPLQQESYADSFWTDTPAHMLAPLLQTRLAQSGKFRAVVLTPSAAKADLRLDCTVLRLQQDFQQTPSVVRLGLQLTLMDNVTREVLAVRTFDVVKSAPSEDAAGGASAANAAVQEGLQQVAAFLQAALAALAGD
jgi:cholesterol transport system auxiliary component